MNGLTDLTVVVPTRGDGSTVLDGVGAVLSMGARLLILNNGDSSIMSPAIESFGEQVTELLEPRMFAEQLRDSANSVETEYVVVVDDDQFLLPSATADAVRILHSNESVQFAFGRILALERSAAGFRITANPKELLWREPIRWRAPTQERLLDLARCWRSGTWYSVMRRQFFASEMELAYAVRTTCSTPSATEVAAEVLGRTVVSRSLGPTALQVRSLIRPSHVLPSHNSSLSYHQWRTSSNYADEVEQFDRMVEDYVVRDAKEIAMRALPLMADDGMQLMDLVSLQAQRGRLLAQRLGVARRPGNLRVGPLVRRLLADQDTQELTRWVRRVVAAHG